MASLYVHGGVSGVAKGRPDLSAAVASGLVAATALDMIEAAVRVMEEDPALNAGFGAVLNKQGKVELDAGIADGATGSFGAVANVTVRNPIALARRVLEDTPHVLITGEGAAALGADMETVRVTDYQSERWRDARDRGVLTLERYGAAENVDTVGAVALDDSGDLAAGSSTGGVFGQMPGRVGDSPIYGAGTYASREVAVVGTGIGELFIETLACARAARLVEDGVHPQEACERVIAYVQSRKRAEAGLLAVAADGRMGAAYQAASWSVAGPEGPVKPTLVR